MIPVRPGPVWHDDMKTHSSTFDSPTIHFRPALFVGVLLALLLFVAGCAAPQLRPPPSLTEAGWVIRQGQGTWTHKRGTPAIQGTLLVAMNVDGRNLVQFSTPTNGTLALAQSSADQWQVQYPAEQKSQSGGRRLPDHVLWLQLPAGLLGNTTQNTEWSFARQREQLFVFWHEVTGERLEGSLRTTHLPPQHVVGADEHIVRVARRYGFTVDALRTVNPGPDIQWFKPGNTINLPPPAVK